MSAETEPFGHPRDILREREDRREMYAERAWREAHQRAIEPERSMSCLAPPHVNAVRAGDRTPHATCAGLRASGSVGCLCECHDADVPASNDGDSSAQ